MILNQTDFFARSATLDGAISDTDTQITLSGLSTRFTDAVAAGTAGYEGGTGLGPFRVDDNNGFELIAITGHVSGTTFEVERGIQGTDAAAWSDGTAVRAVVTSRYVSDNRLVRVTNEAYTNKLDHAINFDVIDQPADGVVLPNGITVSDTDNGWEFSENTLLSTDSDRKVLLDIDMNDHGCIIVGHPDNRRHYLHFDESTQNAVWVDVDQNARRLRIFERVGDTTTELTSTSITASSGLAAIPGKIYIETVNAQNRITAFFMSSSRITAQVDPVVSDFNVLGFEERFIGGHSVLSISVYLRD